MRGVTSPCDPKCLSPVRPRSRNFMNTNLIVTRYDAGPQTPLMSTQMSRGGLLAYTATVRQITSQFSTLGSCGGESATIQNAQTAMATFPYRALDINSHEIRILEFSLEIEESRGASSKLKPSFRGALKHVSLIDTEPYTALSYCWGDLSSDKFLRLDSEETQIHSIAITENLHRALLAVWERRGEKQELRIWVDALCINQSDLYERSQQIQMMRQIYSRAEEVLAWIGPIAGTAPSPAIERSLRKMQMVIPQPTLSSDQARSSRSNSMLTSEDEWDVMISFFNKEYWRRVWIIQEITVASMVTMLYGTVEVSWDFLVPALRSLVKESAHRLGEQGINIGGIGASHLLRFREHWIDTNKPISILQAMTWTTHTKATDPRDKIFALLGLCHDGFRIVPVPNYKQSLKSIISEMSRLSFSLYRSLDLICLKGADTKSQGSAEIPTWAPNWPSLCRCWGRNPFPFRTVP